VLFFAAGQQLVKSGILVLSTATTFVKMSASNSEPTRLLRQRAEEDRKSNMSVVEPEPMSDADDGEVEVEDPCLVTERMERKLVRKIDIRLCTIAGVLCSLNLLDRYNS